MKYKDRVALVCREVAAVSSSFTVCPAPDRPGVRKVSFRYGGRFREIFFADDEPVFRRRGDAIGAIRDRICEACANQEEKQGGTPITVYQG